MAVSADTLGVYLSVPFCRAKCSFCNFASGVGTPEAVEQYVDLLCEEIQGARSTAEQLGVALPEVVDTVYFGGGTPSLLEPAQFERIMSALRGEFSVASGAEMTLEAAPGQIGEALLDVATFMGINRVSLGVQSFVDREAQAVGRSHTESSCRAEFARLRARGIRNVGADLIAGLPYQTERSWEHSLAVAASSGLTHLSVYMLEVDDESRLGREVLGGGARLHAPAVPEDDLIASFYERASELLPKAGFAHYEISNFAEGNAPSRHNLKYWQRRPYLGLGLDAHSMLPSTDGRAVRWANPDELVAYAGAASARSPSWVSEREAFEETVFLGLRLTEGLPRAWMETFRAAWLQEFNRSVDELAHEGLMGSDGRRWWLTERGRVVSSAVFGELLTGALA